MSIIQLFLKELESEAPATRKMLERVPADKFDWQPHQKSMVMRSLATHIAELPSWISMAIHTDGLDFAANPYQPKKIDDAKGLVAYFEETLGQAKSDLANTTEEELQKNWTLRNAEQVYSTSPKAEVIRMSISQIIHHRAQLGVYLRLLNVPIPGTYGPSADEGW